MSKFESRGNRRAAVMGAAVAAAVGAVLAGGPGASVGRAADVTLNNGDTKTYTPVSTQSAGGLSFRTFTGQAVNDTSLVDFGGTANSFGSSDVNQNTTSGQPTTTATQWVGKIRLDATGDYSFATNSDDGSRLFIDGVLVVNNEGGHGATELFKTLNLGAGLHDVRVELVNNTGGGGAQLKYAVGTGRGRPYPAPSSTSPRTTPRSARPSPRATSCRSATTSAWRLGRRAP